MSDESTTPPKFLACPDCEFEWRNPPRPIGLSGVHPLDHKCRRCAKWFVIVWKVTLGARTPLRFVRTVPSLGHHPERRRETYRQIPELDEDTIELHIFTMTARAEGVG